MLRKMFISAMLLILATAATANAQFPKGKWWKNESTVKVLTLTQEQTDKIENIFVESRKKLVELKAAMDKEKINLEVAFDKEELNESEINAQIDKLESARANMQKNEVSFIINVRKILTVEQYKKLREKKKLEIQEEQAKRRERKEAEKIRASGAGDREAPSSQKPRR